MKNEDFHKSESKFILKEKKKKEMKESVGSVSTMYVNIFSIINSS
jgi:hypothetical protein